MTGRTAVVVPVPEAEAAVARWRERYDGSAAQGMPAHVTALFPFVEATREVVTELSAMCAALPVLDVEFRRCGRFPGVLYLAPEPDAGLRRVTEAIVERWPEAPPYEGEFDEIVPHLTVAAGVDDTLAARIEDDLRARLPVRARLECACLYVLEGGRWRIRVELPFDRGTAAG